MLVKGMTPTHARLRSRLLFLLAASVALDLAASVLVFVFERHQPGTGITGLGDALFWTSTQLLTVSSNLPNPVSTPARLLDLVLQMWAISVVAILAGSFGAFFHHRGIQERNQSLAELDDLAARRRARPERSS